MKNYTTLLVLTLVLTLNCLSAQKNTRKYNRLVEKAKSAELKKDYQTSILSYSQARLFSPRKSDFLDDRIKVNVSTLEYQRTTAEKIAEQAQADLAVALTALEKSKTFATTNANLARANANTTQALFLANTDLDLAIALAYQNYQMYPNAPQSTTVLQQLLGQRDACQSFMMANFSTARFALSPDHTLVAVADRFGQLTLRHTDGTLYKKLQNTGSPFTDMRFSNDGTLIATVDARNQWSIWTTEGELQTTHRMATPARHVFFTNSDQNILIINRLGEANLYQRDGVFQQKMGAKVVATTISDVQDILLARQNGQLDWYDKEGVFKKRLFFADPLKEVKTQQEYLLMATQNGTAKLLDTNGTLIRTLPTAGVQQVGFVGAYLLTHNAEGNTEIWDKQGQLLQTINDATNPIQQFAIAPNQQVVWSLTATADLSRCDLFLTMTDSLRMDLPQLMQAGLQPSPEWLETVTDETVLGALLPLLIEQQDWKFVTTTYERLSETVQADPQHLLYYYLAHERMGNDKMELVTTSDDLRTLTLFAAYFYQKQAWQKAFATYQRLVENEETRTPEKVLRWYESGVQLSDSLQVADLKQYAGNTYWHAYGRHFAQRAEWENAKIFYDTLVQTQTALSPVTIMEWYEVNNQLGTADASYLQQYNSAGHQRYFADYFLARQDYAQAALFYQKLATNEPSAEHLLGVYASGKGVGEDKIDLLLQTDSTNYWQQFGDYFLDKNEPAQAKIFYEKLLAADDTPFHRDQVEQVNADLKNYSFAQYFLPRDAEKLREYSRYFYKKGQAKADGQRTEDYRKAAIISEQLLAMEKSRMNRQRLAYFYNLLAWERLIVHDFAGSTTYSLQEKEVKAKQKYYQRILPAANLLAGNNKRAKKLYRKYRRKAAAASGGGQPLRGIYLEDLKDFRSAGLIAEPRMSEVEEILDWLK